MNVPAATALRDDVGFDAPAPHLATTRDLGVRSLQMGIAALQETSAAFQGSLGTAFEEAVQTILQSKGRVIVSGIGKSGLVGRKIAATLASTGTHAFFVHPTEASHGDLGMIARDDVIIALSWSGETAELSDLVGFSRRFSIPLIAVTRNGASTLAKAADLVLELPRVRESCPHDLAPTSSSLVQVALGDALAVALLERRGFTSARFHTLHPGGTLAARLKTVSQVMGTEDMPLVRDTALMSEVLIEIAARRYGCVGVADGAGRLVGIVTDGDLRRHMGPAILDTPVAAVMTREPVTIEPHKLAKAALELMNRRRITVVFAVAADGRPAGIVHVHDLLRAGIA